MTVCDARRLHESKLCLEDGGPVLLANGALNPTTRTAQHWHSVWSITCFGGGAIDPLFKLEEKAHLNAAQGTHLTVSRSNSSTCWAALVVTPIMQPAQALDVAKDIVFIHSTSSCDTTKCTVSVVLVATMAGAVPVARLESSFRRLHALNEDSGTYLENLQNLGDELDRVSNGNDATGLMLSVKATAAGRRRRGRQIRVQPTSLARRRPELTRGSKRVPAGRPPSDLPAKRPRKRPHSLQRNVQDNVPSARLH
ncbi:unnamed protein product, partial [Ixodes persulcatus]